HPSVNKGPTIELAMRINPHIIVQETGKSTHEDRERIKELLGYDVEFKSVRSYSDVSTTDIISNILEKATESYVPN
ncbi:hypothetical protein IH981_04170, partial [Patescibacteria group bacterium]|nr:hypothetical protein [Patescibacteria group bacterium]